jgi:hypothetical protein
MKDVVRTIQRTGGIKMKIKILSGLVLLAGIGFFLLAKTGFIPPAREAEDGASIASGLIGQAG